MRAVAVLAIMLAILATPSVTAHGDTEAMQATVELGPGETVVWQRQVHWHRLMGTVDASGPVTLSLEGPDGEEAAIASGSSLRLDHLVACCRDATWANHIVHLTNPGDAAVDVDVDLALLHDNFAVIADDAEVGAWWQTLAIVGFMVGIPAWRARQPVTESVRDWLRWSRGFHVGAWALAVLIAAIGMARLRTGPLVGTVGATAWAPGDLGGFFNTHSLVMLALMATWGTAYALWAGARRRGGGALRVDGYAFAAGPVLVATALASEYGLGWITIVMGLLPAAAVLADVAVRPPASAKSLPPDSGAQT